MSSMSETCENTWFPAKLFRPASTTGVFLSQMAEALFNTNLARVNVRFMIIEGGSIVAVAGGMLSYIHGDTLVGNGGLLLGIAGIITAATPIVQGWLSTMREERKAKIDRLEIPTKIRENELSITMLKDEITDLKASITFKRELIEQQQRVINILVNRVGSIEIVAAKAAETVSAVSAKVDSAGAALAAPTPLVAEVKAGKNEQPVEGTAVGDRGLCG